MGYTSVRVSSVLFLGNNENLPCASKRLRISLLTHPSMQTTCANQAYKK